MRDIQASALATTVPQFVGETIVSDGDIYRSVGLTPGAFEKISSSVSRSIPRWQKFSVPLSALSGGTVNGSSHLELLLTTIASFTSILAVALSRTEGFDGPQPWASMIDRSVGIVQGETVSEGAILPVDTFGDFSPNTFATSQSFVFLTSGAQIKLFLTLPMATTLEDYLALTAGAIDVWLLLSVLVD